MASIRIAGSQIACISKKHIIVIQLGSEESHLYQSQKPQITDIEKKKQQQGNEEGSEQVLACGYSPTGRYFVSCDDYKQLTLWAVQGNGTWQAISTRSVARRVTSLMFRRDESFVLVADKSGDVFQFSLTLPDQDGQLLMGHVSMLLDLVLCKGEELLASCDRDEKIRLSHYPNAHSIYGYCLGHTDFVSRLVYVEEEDVIISGSGDGTIRIWNYISSRQIAKTDCHPHLEKYLNSHETESNTETTESKNLEGGKRKLDVRQSDGLDLKCLACCHKLKLLVVGFERVPVILIYKFITQQGDSAQLTLNFVQEISLQGHLWDAAFDAKDQLWVLQAWPDRPLEVYCTEKSSGEKTEKLVTLDESQDVDNVLPTAVAFGKHWNLLKDCLEGDSLFSILHKIKIDNASFYQERKQQKMSEQQQRYKEKADRRKLAKAVLPSAESNKHHSEMIEGHVAPSGECAEPNSKMIKVNE